MAQVVPKMSPGSLLLDPNAPYSRYLRALKDVSYDAKRPEAALHVARQTLDGERDLSKPGPVRSARNAHLAAIIDISPVQGGNSVANVAQLDEAQLEGEHLGTINSKVADAFFDSLRTCAADIHTRVVVLQDYMPVQSEHDRAVQTLFNSHLLGIELDLAPAHVCNFLRHRYQQSYTSRYLHPPLVDACVRFETSPTSQDETVPEQRNNIASYLGRKKTGDGFPHTGKHIWSFYRAFSS